MWNNDEVGPEDSAKGSNFFFVHTDATNYDMSGSFDLLCEIGGCISDVYSTFAPAKGSVSVPEPATGLLLGGGLIGLWVRRRCFKKTA